MKNGSACATYFNDFFRLVPFTAVKIISAASEMLIAFWAVLVFASFILFFVFRKAAKETARRSPECLFFLGYAGGQGLRFIKSRPS